MLESYILLIGNFKTKRTLHESKTTTDIKNPCCNFVENIIWKLHSKNDMNNSYMVDQNDPFQSFKHYYYTSQYTCGNSTACLTIKQETYCQLLLPPSSSNKPVKKHAVLCFKHHD